MQEQLALLLSRLPRQPIATIGLAAIMVVASLFAVAMDGGEGSDTRLAVDKARTFFEQNAEVDVSERNRQLLGADFVDVVTTAFEKEKDRGAGPIFSARMQGRTQKRFEALADDAFEARMREFPAWRFGVAGTTTPAANHLTHVFVHASLLAVAVSVVFFVVAGIGLELAWGALIFAGFCLLGTLLPSIAFRLVDFDGGAPLAGATGLVTAILGAYMVRGFGGNLPLPGWALLPIWAFVDLFFIEGVWIDNLGSAPYAAMATGLVFGVGASALLRVLGVEKKIAELVDQAGEPDRHPAIALAELAIERQDPEAAWSALTTARSESPDNVEIVIARFQLACDLGRVEQAAGDILPILQDRLKKGGTAEAVGYWRPIVLAGLAVDLPPPALVRLGEGLLDDGHPDIAVETLGRALDHPSRLSTSLARRVVRVARDLDPTLTHRAAALALEDPELDPDSRESLEKLAVEVRAAMPAAPAAAPTPRLQAAPAAAPPAPTPPAPAARPPAAPPPVSEATRFPIEADIDLDSSAELTDPDEFHALHGGHAEATDSEPEIDPNALSIRSIERELAAGGLGFDDDSDATTDPDQSAWNDPGLRPGLTAEDTDERPALFERDGLSDAHVDNSYLEAGALTPDALTADTDTGIGSGSDTAPLPLLGSSPAPLGAGGGDAQNRLGAAGMQSPVTGADADSPLAPLGTTPLAAMDEALMLAAAEGDTAPMAVDASELTPAQPVARIAEAPGAPPPVAPAPAPSAPAPAASPALARDPAPPSPQPRAQPTSTSGSASPFGDDELQMDFDLGEPPLRPLKLVVGVPIGAKAQALEVEVEGKGVSRVPFERIEAVAVAAVAGLSDKPVLIIDLVLNWLASPDEPLKVVRFHSNRFDPTGIVPSASSALDAMRRLVAGIVKQSGATPLPDDAAAAGAPFARYPDAATYEREVLGARV